MTPPLECRTGFERNIRVFIYNGYPTLGRAPAWKPLVGLKQPHCHGNSVYTECHGHYTRWLSSVHSPAALGKRRRIVCSMIVVPIATLTHYHLPNYCLSS
jgi:hypothetical protein